MQVEHDAAELVVNVFDWDLVGKDEYIGVVHVCVAELVASGRGEFVVLGENCDAVVGHDGEPCVIVLECVRLDMADVAAGGFRSLKCLPCVA